MAGFKGAIEGTSRAPIVNKATVCSTQACITGYGILFQKPSSILNTYHYYDVKDFGTHCVLPFLKLGLLVLQVVLVV